MHKASIFGVLQLYLKSDMQGKSLCVTKTSLSGIPSADYTIGLKVRLCSSQAWKQIYLFSLYYFARAF